jgi:O-antigen/teichoic acid export membrane protein
MRLSRFTTQFSRRGAEALLMNGAGAILVFLMQARVARQLGVVGYGVWGHAFALAWLLVPVATLGSLTAVARFTAAYTARGQHALLRGLLARATQVLAPAALATALVLKLISDGLTGQVADNIRYAALLIPALVLISGCRRAYQGLRRVKASLAAETLVLPLASIAVFAVLQTTAVGDAVRIYAGMALALGAAQAVALWLIVRGGPGRRARSYETAVWARAALPMVAVGIGKAALDRTGVLVLGIVSSMDTVGRYSAAVRAARLAVFARRAVAHVVAPRFSAAIATGKHDAFRAAYQRAQRWSLAGALPVGAALLIAPGLLGSAFGADFASAGRFARILVVGAIAEAAAGPVTAALVMAGRERSVAVSTVTVAMASVVASVIGAKAWGATGVACATALAGLALVVWQLSILGRLRVVDEPGGASAR